jgi:hypothetical protein
MSGDINMKHGLIAALLISSTYSLWAQVHKTLPKGVRLVAYRNVTTNTIKATYNQSQSETPMSYDINADSKSLEQVSDEIKAYFDWIRTQNPNAYNQFTLGEFNLQARAKLNVQGMGMGYGITDRLTVYGILPYYKAEVQMRYKQLKATNNQQIADDLYDTAGGDVDTAIANLTGSNVDVNGNLLQSIVVNTFQYDQIGTWNGQGYGDMEFGAMYNLINRTLWGLSATGGVVAPTGRVDDPDILQDIGFGDGQWDAFSEVAVGYLATNRLTLGSTLRYTYQMPGERRLRIPNSRDFMLSDQTGDFTVKYGNRWDATLSANYAFNDWFSLTPAYDFGYQGSSKYESNFGEANDYLAYNSDRMSHTGRLTASISSIQPFLKKQFLLPASVNVIVQQTLGGRNVPKVGRFEVEFRLLF